MGSKPWLYPAPIYRPLETYWESDEDAPGPRCGHTLTAVAATKTHGHRLILFGGATAVEDGNGGAAGIRLAGVTNSIHSYDVLTGKWTRLRPAGEPPSPRAAHAAAAVGTNSWFAESVSFRPFRNGNATNLDVVPGSERICFDSALHVLKTAINCGSERKRWKVKWESRCKLLDASEGLRKWSPL